MHISFLLPHLQLYGGIRRVLELSNHLVDRGYRVSIFHSNGSMCNWMETRAAIYSLRDFFNKEHDILIYTFQSLYPEAKTASASRKYYYNLNLFNKRLLALPLTLLRLGKRFSYQVTVAYEIRRALLNTNFSLIVNCTDSQMWIKKHLQRDANVVFGGINSNIFYPLIGTKNEQGIKVLHAGSWKFWKDAEMIERALAVVKERYPGVFSDTYYGKNLPQSEMAKVYSSANIFVDAQYYAGWNNPVAEAMACKTPVVCTDIGPNSDIAVHEKTALLVPVGDAHAMADAIARLINDASLREHLVENAYRKISEFTWERAAYQFVGALDHDTGN